MAVHRLEGRVWMEFCEQALDSLKQAVAQCTGEDSSIEPLTKEELEERTDISDNLRFELGDTGITLRYSWLSQRGYYPEDLEKPNQDAFKVIPSFGGNPQCFFMGVFDGHGSAGDPIAYYVRDNVQEMLERNMQRFPNDFNQAYRSTYLALNQRVHGQVSTCPCSHANPDREHVACRH